MKLPHQIGLYTPEPENSEILYIVFMTIPKALQIAQDELKCLLN